MTTFKLAFLGTLKNRIKPPKLPQVTEELPKVEEMPTEMRLRAGQKLVFDTLLGAVRD